jgi:hypothetical protein
LPDFVKKKGESEPVAVIKLQGCFYFKDFGIINCELTGFRIINLGVKLYNIARRYDKETERYSELV